jgi:hypothetical protein
MPEVKLSVFQRIRPGAGIHHFGFIRANADESDSVLIASLTTHELAGEIQRYGYQKGQEVEIANIVIVIVTIDAAGEVDIRSPLSGIEISDLAFELQKLTK